MDWRTIPSISALRAFEVMARLIGVSAAARELNVTHAVKYLEEYLTLKLAYREASRDALDPQWGCSVKGTPDGFQTIVRGIRTVRADDEARPLQRTLTPMSVENWLMPRLGSFWAEHP